MSSALHTEPNIRVQPCSSGVSSPVQFAVRVVPVHTLQDSVQNDSG